MQSRVADFYHAYLQQGKSGGIGRQYCLDRGIDEATCVRFNVGFAPDTQVISQKVALECESPQLAIELGLIGVGKNSHRSYDVLRNRLVFPIENENGQVVALGGRLIDAGQGPKYLNTKSTAIYDKSETLYGLNHVLSAHPRPDQITFAEGYMDVLSLHQSGFDTAVATCGTSVTDRHLAKAFSYANVIHFVFDGDKAGVKAAQSAAVKSIPFLNQHRTVRFTYLKEGEDPDSVLQNEGKAALSALLDQSVSVFNVLDHQLSKHIDFTQADHRIEYGKRVARLLQQVLPECQPAFISEIGKQRSQDIKSLLATIMPNNIVKASSHQPEILL
jgi:DNA primase